MALILGRLLGVQARLTLVSTSDFCVLAWSFDFAALRLRSGRAGLGSCFWGPFTLSVAPAESKGDGALHDFNVDTA